MIKRKAEKGQAIILIVFGIIGLVSFTALAIDSGNVYSDRRQAQTAADTAAFAGALTKINNSGLTGPALQTAISNAATSRAASNGYTNDGTSSVVQVYNPPTSGTYSGNSEYIQVVITSNVKTYFAPVLGIQQITNKVEAIARAKAGSSNTPYFNGSALVALKQTGSDTFMANGNVTAVIHNSGIFSNSTSNCGAGFNGHVDVTVDGAIASAGTVCANGNINLHGSTVSDHQTQMPYPPNISVPDILDTCSGSGHNSGNTYYPGNYSGISINSNNSVTLSPGTYCLTSDFSIDGNTTVTANNVTIIMNNGSFSLNGNSNMSCSNFIFYAKQGSFTVNGNNHLTCNSATFRLDNNSITWNGNATINLSAQTSGDYKGLLIYMPYGNSSPLTLNGNSSNTITGTIMAPSADVTINGNSGTSGYHSQIVGDTITLNGNSSTNMYWNAAENFTGNSLPTIELTK